MEDTRTSKDMIHSDRNRFWRFILKPDRYALYLTFHNDRSQILTCSSFGEKNMIRSDKEQPRGDNTFFLKLKNQAEKVVISSAIQSNKKSSPKLENQIRIPGVSDLSKARFCRSCKSINKLTCKCPIEESTEVEVENQTGSKLRKSIREKLRNLLIVFQILIIYQTLKPLSSIPVLRAAETATSKTANPSDWLLSAANWKNQIPKEDSEINNNQYGDSLDRLMHEDVRFVQDDRHLNQRRQRKKKHIDINKQHTRKNNRKQPHQGTKEPKSNAEPRHRRHGGFFGDENADRPVVATRKGLVRGVTQKLFTGKFVDAFLGIPYAQPPLGKYRFRHPQPMNAWSGELDASRMSNSCYQVNDTFFGANFPGTSVWNANTKLSEDCLYLNIWTPFGTANTTVTPNTPDKVINYRPLNERNSARSAKRPVLVWIFGGGFYSGTSSLALYEGGVLASEEDIVVVSMNYRVSALGFLYFGRPDSPGNAGLFDQLLALQWVNDNIDQFGGDASRVTIFGESAGAVSISFHLLSPLSRNLFSQAILQSGAATCPWGFKEPREIMANGLQLASLVNCSSNGTDLDAVVDCLVEADPLALVSQEVGQTKSLLNFPFVPVVDGSFLIEPPSESLLKSNFKQARLLLGSNYDEGNSWLIYLPEFSHCPSTNGEGPPSIKQANQPDSQEGQASDMLNETNMSNSELRDQAGPSTNFENSDATIHQYSTSTSSIMSAEAEAQHGLNFNDSKPCIPNNYLSLSRRDFFRILREDLNPHAEHPIGKDAIVFEYSNWNNPQDPVSNYDALDKIVGDYYFTCHVNEFAHRYAIAGNQVFMYYFKQRSSISPWPKWMGVIHGEEVSFVFGEPLNQVFNYTAKEVELSRRMMRYWANFAKYGNPTKNGENASMPEKWPGYADKRQYFELHSDFVRIGRGPRSKQCEFWSRYLPKLIENFDRRWRNQRATASMNQQQREHASNQATTASAPTTTTTNTSATVNSNTFQETNSSHSSRPFQKLANAQVGNVSGNLSSTRSGGLYQKPVVQGSGMQLHNMRPMGPATSQLVGTKQPVMASATTATVAANQSQATEQSALDMAQLAAARVTGSAAAAIAAAKFKMLRSNTLAAAFGRSAAEADPAAAAGEGAPMDLMAVRTKDERIINTLSSAGAKNRLNLNAK